MAGPALFIYLLMYIIICPFFVHSLIEFHFYAFYSSLSLKQAVAWRARRGKHNHGALWLIMDLHRWFVNFRNWIIALHTWIYGDSWFELWSSISFDLWRSQFDSWSSTICCYGAPNNLWGSIIHMMKLHNIHRPTLELHDWNVDGVS